MSAFLPPACPHPACPSRSGAPFLFHKDGFYARAADGRRVQRFRCRSCGRCCSAQTFRGDYRLRRPQLDVPILSCLVSKVTLRQTARILRTDRKTVHHRLRLYARIGRELHEAHLRRALARGGLAGSFSLDEAETFEHNRRLKPLTVPVLIHRATRFLVHFEVGTLPARGRLKGRDAARKRMEPRRSESSEKVDLCLAALRRVHAPSPLALVVDQKKSYRPLILKHFGDRSRTIVMVSSKQARNPSNPMFAINHTLATLRDHLSRLVRRTWATTKRRRFLEDHGWVFVAYRNYARPLSNQLRRLSSAMALGLTDRIYGLAELLRWRWPLLSLRAA